MNITRIVKNVLPAVVVLAAGLFGMNFVYNTYMKDGSTSVISLEPSAGEDATSSETASESAVEPSTMTEAAMPKEEMSGMTGNAETMPASTEEKPMMKTDCATHSADGKPAAESGEMMEGCDAAAQTPAAGAEMESGMMKDSEEMMSKEKMMTPESMPEGKMEAPAAQ